MPIYVARFVVVVENQWLSDTAPFAVLRRSLKHDVATQIFAARDPEAAYQRAIAMVGGLSDSHNDGPGDRTNFSCIGLQDLEEVPLFGRTLAESLDEPYGLDVGHVDVGEVVPEVRTREELSLFAAPDAQWRNLRRR
jgi:hypothetical protein